MGLSPTMTPATTTGTTTGTLVAPKPKGIIDPSTGKPVGANDPFFGAINEELSDKGFLVTSSEALITWARRLSSSCRRSSRASSASARLCWSCRSRVKPSKIGRLTLMPKDAGRSSWLAGVTT